MQHILLVIWGALFPLSVLVACLLSVAHLLSYMCCSHVLCVCPTSLAGLSKCSHAHLLHAIHNESLPSWDGEGTYNLYIVLGLVECMQFSLLHVLMHTTIDLPVL